MASKNLNLVITAVDKASKEIKGIGKNLQGFASRNKKDFQGMAIGGTAAFAGITAAVKKATDMAAKSEGTWNKFNTVFGEGSDDMKAFVDDIREEMPVATDRIARMAADTQDLLVPMGLARDEAKSLTKQSLDLANKIAAFNDADPSDVLESMKAGFVGQSEPLRKYGIMADQATLAQKAFDMGLTDTLMRFQEMDPAIRGQIRSQALMQQMTEQSSDAISGFEKNSDSLIFRQLELNATIKDLTTTIGKAFVPIVDKALKAILPIVEDIASWIEENQELTKNILLVSAALSGVIAVIGTIGLLIPSVITVFSALGTALTVLTGPIGIVVAAIAGLAVAWKKNVFDIQGKTQKVIDWIVPYINKGLETIKAFWADWGDTILIYVDALVSGLKDAFKITLNIIKTSVEGWIIIFKGLKEAWDNNLLGIKSITMWVFKFIKTNIQTQIDTIKTIINVALSLIKGDWEGAWNYIKDFAGRSMERAKELIKGPLEWIQDKIGGLFDKLKQLPDKAKDLASKAKDSISGIGSNIAGSVKGVFGQRALGGPVQANRSYLVGENGPEIFTPNGSGRINNNAGGSTNININMGGVTVNNEADENRLVDKIKRELIKDTKRFNYGII